MLNNVQTLTSMRENFDENLRVECENDFEKVVRNLQNRGKTQTFSTGVLLIFNGLNRYLKKSREDVF